MKIFWGIEEKVDSTLNFVDSGKIDPALLLTQYRVRVLSIHVIRMSKSGKEWKYLGKLLQELCKATTYSDTYDGELVYSLIRDTNSLVFFKAITGSFENLSLSHDDFLIPRKALENKYILFLDSPNLDSWQEALLVLLMKEHRSHHCDNLVLSFVREKVSLTLSS